MTTPHPTRAPRTAATGTVLTGNAMGLTHRRTGWIGRPEGPTPLRLRDLIALTRRVADQVNAGQHPVHLDRHVRWHQRLHGDDHVDVWLISWATEQSAELHDHAGSLGAMTVVTGELIEWRWTAGLGEPWTRTPTGHAPHVPRLRRRVVTAGHSVGFGLGHVHDVGNRDLPPAVSVHAYSPPLTAMSYYTVEGAMLRRTRTELTG